MRRKAKRVFIGILTAALMLNNVMVSLADTDIGGLVQIPVKDANGMGAAVRVASGSNSDAKEPDRTASSSDAVMSVSIAEGNIVIENNKVSAGEEVLGAVPEEGIVISGESTENHITLRGGSEESPLKVTISGLSISSEVLEADKAYSLIDIAGGHVELTLDGENTLENAGGDKAVVHVAPNAALTVVGDGSLGIWNGLETGNARNEAHGAGIGGNREEAPGSITINSGTITVTEFGTSAGIGGGARADSGKIRITGGNVDVTVLPVGGSMKCAGTGIGGGGESINNSSLIGSAGNADIAITGGFVKAYAKSNQFLLGNYSSGAAIGSGENKGGTIYIGGTAVVEAEAENLACAIGSSHGGYTEMSNINPPPDDPMKITIEGDAQVTAKTHSLDFYGQGGYSGAAIGISAQNLQPCTIVIGGNAKVDAQGSWYGAGIGGGFVQINRHAQPVSITIKDEADVTASAEIYGAGIGSGFGSAGAESATIVIEGNPTVHAYGGWGGAGIGGGKGTQGGSITITGGTIYAEGDVGGRDTFGTIGGAGIGSGAVSDTQGAGGLSGDIYIGGDADVTAVGSDGSAGIGGGNIKAVTTTGVPSVGSATKNGGGAKSITITDHARVYAVGGSGASAIGTGAAYDGHDPYVESLTITDGTHIEAYADGTKFAVDRMIKDGGESVTDAILNGRFAEFGTEDTLTEDQENPVNLLLDGGVDALAGEDGCLVIPANYRSFASTVSIEDDGLHMVKLQDAARNVYYAYYDGDTSNIQYDVKQNEMLTKDNLRWMKMENIHIKPVDMTIYVGGDGYEGVTHNAAGRAMSVSRAVSGNGIPEPVFEITGIENPEELTLRNADTGAEWKAVSAGENTYRLETVGEAEPARMVYTNPETGETIGNDAFDPQEEQELFATYSAELYAGEHENAFSFYVAAEDEAGASYTVTTEPAVLTVRAVENTDAGKTVTDVLTDKPQTGLESGTAAVWAPAGTTYTINDKGIELKDGARPSLLFDDIITSDGKERIQPLKDASDSHLGLPAMNAERNYELKYLDLVDTNDGNVWITASQPVTIYWAYPEGTDSNTEFKLLHFKGLHRDSTSDGGNTGFDPADIAGAEIETVSVETADFGISFQVGSGGFSPFVLVWDTVTEEGGEDPDPDKPGTEEPDPDPDKPGTEEPDPDPDKPGTEEPDPDPDKPGTEEPDPDPDKPGTEEPDPDPDKPGTEEPDRPQGGDSGDSDDDNGGGGSSGNGGRPSHGSGTSTPTAQVPTPPAKESSDPPHPEINRLPNMGDEQFGPGMTYTAEEDQENTVVTVDETKEIIPQLQSYYEQNSDLRGWLTVPGTGFGYPVMKTVSPYDYYLHHNFSRQSDAVGIPFIGEGCDAGDMNVLIHGHNMNGVLQFGYIWNYQYPSFRAKNPYIDFKSLYDEDGSYEVMAVFFAPVYPEEAEGVFKWYQYVGDMNKAQFDYYVENVKASSLYDTGVTAVYGDKLITLETCADSKTNTRLVVVARKQAAQNAQEAAVTAAEAGIEQLQ
jgi:SrtB family sortase